MPIVSPYSPPLPQLACRLAFRPWGIALLQGIEFHFFLNYIYRNYIDCFFLIFVTFLYFQRVYVLYAYSVHVYAAL